MRVISRSSSRLTSRVAFADHVSASNPSSICAELASIRRELAEADRFRLSAAAEHTRTRHHRTRFRRLLAVVPFAWHYDPVFLRAAIGTGIALAVFPGSLIDPPSQHMQASRAYGTASASRQ